MQKKLAMINESKKNSRCLSVSFAIFLIVQGAVFSCLCAGASPSTQYSTFRNIISIKFVCGQAHPQNNLPNAAVNRMIKKTKRNHGKTEYEKSLVARISYQIK